MCTDRRFEFSGKAAIVYQYHRNQWTVVEDWTTWGHFCCPESAIALSRSCKEVLLATVSDTACSVVYDRYRHGKRVERYRWGEDDPEQEPGATDSTWTELDDGGWMLFESSLRPDFFPGSGDGFDYLDRLTRELGVRLRSWSPYTPGSEARLDWEELPEQFLEDMLLLEESW